jgi:hypothetical protein
VAVVASNDVTPRVNQVSQGLATSLPQQKQPSFPYWNPPTPSLSDPIILSVQFVVRALLKRTRRPKVKPYKASFSGVEIAVTQTEWERSKETESGKAIIALTNDEQNLHTNPLLLLRLSLETHASTCFPAVPVARPL